jgi:UDP-N-acetylglucosamine transferase subunit ALG13
MIFMTVGSMLPFDRLVQSMDEWAARHPQVEVFAQIGAGAYEPRHMKWTRTLSRREFDDHTRDAELVVAHAGVGSVVTALEFRKPIVVLPRFAAAKEHTTNHQVDTAKWMQGRPGVFVAMAEKDLDQAIIDAQAANQVEPLPSSAPPEFIAKIRAFLMESLDRK